MRKIGFVLLLFALVCIFSCRVFGQDKPKQEKKLSVLYNSSNFINLDITLTGEKTSKVKVPEGGLVRLEIEKLPYAINIKSINLKSGEVIIDFLYIKKELKNDTLVSESFNLIESFKLDRKIGVVAPVGEKLKLVLKVKKVYKSK